MSAVPVPESEIGVDWIDGIINLAIGARVYSDFTQASQAQTQTTTQVERDQNVGAVPVTPEYVMQAVTGGGAGSWVAAGVALAVAALAVYLVNR
jgi:hypothetical protein